MSNSLILSVTMERQTAILEVYRLDVERLEQADRELLAASSVRHVVELTPAFDENWGLSLQEPSNRAPASSIRDHEAFERLAEVGKRRGFITSDELNEALPDTLSSEEVDDLLKLFEQLEIPVLDVRPGAQVLAVFGQAMSLRFDQLGSWESASHAAADYSQLVAVQAIRSEELLREIFLSGSPPIEVLATFANPDERELLLEFARGSIRPSLWLLHSLSNGLRRAIRDENVAASTWALARFMPVSGRFSGESRSSLEILSDGALSRFLDEFRTRYRNPLAHGEAGIMTLRDYTEWCDFAFATRTLRHWLEFGVTPSIYRAEHAGWLSLLCSAVARSSG